MKLYWFSQDKNKYLLFILLVTIFTRVLYFIQFKENPFFYLVHETSDAINFDIGAQNFSSGDLLASSPNNSYSPLYKYFIGFIYIFAGRNLPVVWGIQLWMGIITVLLVYLITQKLFNTHAAFISAFLYAFFGPEIMYEGVLLRASLISFLGVLSLYLLVNLEGNKKIFITVITGFVVSLFIQCRPNVILVFVILLIIPPYTLNKKTIQKTVSLSFVVLLFFIPLLIQAYVVHGKFVFFDASGPLTFLMGNNPEYQGAYFLPEFRDYSGETSLGYGEIVFLFVRNFINHPVDFITLYLRKLYYFFNSYEFSSNYNYYIFQEFSFLLKNPFTNFALFSSLGLMGFLINIHDFKRLRLLNGFLVGMTLSVILFYVVGRFRVPVVPYYAIYAGSLLDKIWNWYQFKRYQKSFISISAAILLLLLFNTFPDISKTNTANNYGNLGSAYLNIGNREKAVAAFNQSLKIDPNNFYSYNNLGKIYAENKQFSKAIQEFIRSTEIKPDQWEPYYNLGLIYLHSGQFVLAEKVLLSAYKLAPQRAQITFNLGNLYENAGLLDKSLEFYQIYISLAEKDWRGHFQIGNVLSRLGRFKIALKEYNYSKRLNPKHTPTLLNLGNVYLSINRPRLALKEYLLAKSLNNQDPVIHRNIGILLSKKDFYDPLKAVYHLKRSLELDPNQNLAELIENLIKNMDSQ